MRAFWFWFWFVPTLMAFVIAIGCLGFVLVLAGTGFWEWVTTDTWPQYTMDDVLPHWAWVSGMLALVSMKPALPLMVKFANGLVSIGNVALAAAQRLLSRRN